MENVKQAILLETKMLSKNYGSTCALDHVQLRVPSGRVVGILGPNGSGKSTLLSLIGGLLPPSSGQIRIAGLPPGQRSKQIVAFLPEKPYLSDWMWIRDLFAMFADYFPDFDRHKAVTLAASLGLREQARVSTLSRAMREKLQLVLTMSRHAQLYLLDEPMAGVDPAARDYILATILSGCDPRATILIATHLLREIETLLDDVIFLRRGQAILYDQVAAVHTRYGKSLDALLREVFSHAR